MATQRQIEMTGVDPLRIHPPSHGCGRARIWRSTERTVKAAMSMCRLCLVGKSFR